MQAVFHSWVGFQGDFVVLHASSCVDRQRKRVVVSLWRRRMHLVLSVDKTDVEQCLPYVETLTGDTATKKLRHRRRRCGHDGLLSFFFFADKRAFASCRHGREPLGAGSFAEASAVFLL